MPPVLTTSKTGGQMVHASRHILQSASEKLPYTGVDLYCFAPDEVKVNADNGAGMSVGFTVSADTAERIARELLEVVAAARAAKPQVPASAVEVPL